MDYKEKAIENFLNKEFEEALKNYSQVLKDAPSDKEARIGALLCDMALDNENEAVALFEFYLASKENDENSEEMIESIIQTYDTGLELVGEMMKQDIAEEMMFENGISYEDFKAIVHSRSSFKEAYQDILHSTRVIITKKEDFFDFIDRLIENGYVDVALGYMESASSVFIADAELEKLADKIQMMRKA